MISQEKILIVGGSGFIGSHLVEDAIARGFEVTVLSLNLPKPERKFDRAEYILADISSINELCNALDGRQYHHVINLGGYINHAPLSKGGVEVLNIHFIGVMNLVQCIDRSILKTFIQFGSSDEYGNNQAPQNELQREAPISPYSLAKVAATQFLHMLHRAEGFPVITFRLFLTYGPGQDQSRFIPQIIRGCLDGTSFPASAGLQLRDFCYIDDVVEAVFVAIEKPKVRGEIVNIASGKAITVRSVIETIQRLIGQGTPRYGDVLYRSGENMELYADISKAKSLLEWKPKICLENGLKNTIDWIRDHS